MGPQHGDGIGIDAPPARPPLTFEAPVEHHVNGFLHGATANQFTFGLQGLSTDDPVPLAEENASERRARQELGDELSA